MTIELYVLPAGHGTPPTAADLEGAVKVSGYVSTDGINTLGLAAETTVTRLDRTFEVTAELMAINADEVVRILTDLATAMQEHEDAIREAHAALEAAKTGPDRRQGRVAQRSPYDIGRNR